MSILAFHVPHPLPTSTTASFDGLKVGAIASRRDGASFPRRRNSHVRCLPARPVRRRHTAERWHPGVQTTVTASASEPEKNEETGQGLPSRLRKICKQLRDQPDDKTRIVKLAELGDSIPMLDYNTLSADSRVTGCTSITHLVVSRTASGIVHIQGYSDSRFARGLLALLVLGVDGASEKVVLGLSARSILKASGIVSDAAGGEAGGVGALKSVSPRHNGLGAMLNAVHAALARADDDDEEGVSAENDGSEKRRIDELLNGRWTDGVQGSDEVAVLLSGGVDSSVALRLAQESGKKVRAFYLKIWLDDESAHLGVACPWEEDLQYAAAVCAQAGVRLDDVPLQQVYWDEVVGYTVAEARRGRTPNPDVMCNARVKFGAFYRAVVDGGGFGSVVTGHYARRGECASTGEATLQLSADVHKDQTYFLSHLTQAQVSRAQFPLGALTKPEVRRLARAYGLPNRDRPDSQGICFLGKLRFDEFLALHVGERPGPLVDYDSGERVGSHRGFWFFTPGQRRGIGLSGGPWYVVAKDPDRNAVFVSRHFHAPDKTRRAFRFDSPVWIADRWPAGLARAGDSARLRVKTRHGPAIHGATVTRTGADSGAVLLDSRDKGLATGQFCAFYNDSDDTCLGSGIICDEPSVHTAPHEIVERLPGAKRLQAHHLPV